MDIAFVLDESSSLTADQFDIMKDFMRRTIEPLSFGEVQVGLMTFSSSYVTRWWLNQGNTKSLTLNMLKNVKMRGGNTRTDQALGYLPTYMNKGRVDAMKIAILITDGQSDDLTATAQNAAKARAAGITMIAVGVGSYNRKELEDIGSKPLNEHVFGVKAFSGLIDIIEGTMKSMCAGDYS